MDTYTKVSICFYVYAVYNDPYARI